MRSRHEWRCSTCGKLLGIITRGRVHIKFTRSHEYIVGFPATCSCRACGTLNEHRANPDTITQGTAARR